METFQPSQSLLIQIQWLHLAHGGRIAIPYCREEVQIRDIAPERNLAYFHSETLCVCTVDPVALIPMEDATLPVNFSRTLVNSACA